MAETVTELSLRWKRVPDAPNTIALANAVRGPLHASLIDEVGSFATDRLGNEVPVLLAIARMYMSAQRFNDAQTILVSAGKVAPREPQVYRVLGEVLLRRGDAERAEKVLERAMQLGNTDSTTRLWLDRARVFKPMQSKIGTKAVAAEVEHTSPAAALDAASDSLAPPPSERTRPVVDEDPPTSVRVGAALAAGRKATSLAPPPLSRPPPSSRRPATVPPRNSRPPGAASTGENRAMPGGAAAGLTPAGMPKAQPAFLFDQAVPGPPRMPGEMEESVTFDLAAAPLPGNPPAFGGTIGDISARPPEARELLEALGLAGIYEPPSRQAGTYEWAKPARGPKKRGTWLLVAALLVFVGGSIATYYYVDQQRTLRRAAADAAMAEIESGLLDGRVTRIPDVERAFSRAFELDSRSSRAALAWARERALVGLLRGGQDVAFEDASSRARTVGIKDNDLAFTQVGSFLFQNDNAGAVSILSRYDSIAGNDPWYQLLAGTCLERLGDARAQERYATAVKLSPDFVPAQVALTRYEIIEGDRARAAELVAQFRQRHGDRPEVLALSALLWARDPQKSKPPAEVLELAAKREQLPLILAAVPHAVAARLALEKGSVSDARDAIRHGLAAADGPGFASWLGFLALDADDEALARKAALGAVAYSAIYPRARALAARVALTGGRLDEALKATEELEPTQVDVALARAVVAYEKCDADAVARAIEALPEDRRKASSLGSIALAQSALAGKNEISPSKIAARAAADELWSDIVAMDIALDGGNLDAASAIGNRWLAQAGKDPLPPLRALRLARLARYQNRLDDAETLSAAALAGATPTLRTVLERALVLAARDKPGEIGPMLARNQSAAGPFASWLGAFATASAGKPDDARGRSSSLDIPPDNAPVPVRTVVAIALGAMKDKKRGAPVVQALLSRGLNNADVITAAQGVGLRPAPPKK